MIQQESGSLESIHLAPAKGAPRESVASVRVRCDWGIEGDAYGGPGERQLLLFWSEARAALDSNRKGTGETSGLCYPRFRENLTVEGLDPGSLRPGDLLEVGSSLLRVTAVHKRCYPECELPRDRCEIRGHLAFCAVESEGEMSRGDRVLLLGPTDSHYIACGGIDET